MNSSIHNWYNWNILVFKVPYDIVYSCSWFQCCIYTEECVSVHVFYRHVISSVVTAVSFISSWRINIGFNSTKCPAQYEVNINNICVLKIKYIIQNCIAKWFEFCQHLIWWNWRVKFISEMMVHRSLTSPCTERGAAMFSSLSAYLQLSVMMTINV